MIEVYVLNKNLEQIGMIDSYTSLIWANRYAEKGDCELYIEATTTNLNLLKKGNYLIRHDDEMVCRIETIELDTDVENGNYVIVTGYDVKKILDQRVIWGQSSVDGTVEDYIRDLVYKSLVNPNLSARQIKNEDGRANFFLGDKANFNEVTSEQNSYNNIGEKIREFCTKYKWGYKVIVDDTTKNFYFLLYNGTDRSDYVVFSTDYENLITSKYKEDSSNLANVALVAGEGEGSDRARNVSGYAESLDRNEIYVDAKDISRTISWSDLIAMYPTTDDGGYGHIYKTAQEGAAYMMDIIDIPIVDSNQLAELKRAYPTGQEITKNGIKYFQAYNVIIADLPNFAPDENDDVILRDIVYSVYLLNRGYEKLAEYGSVKSFEGTVEPTTTFEYKKDYWLGDLVTVENEYGISVTARIVEIIEVNDNNGYSIEPKFEYLEEDDPTPTVVSGYILTENASKMLTENSRYLVREEAIVPETLALNDDPSTDTENIKISQLPEIELLQDGCCMPVVSDGQTTKMYYSKLKEKLQQDLQISIPIATADVLGAVKVGNYLTVEADGTLNAVKQTDNNYTTEEKNKLAGLSNYSLPIASESVLGGIKIGANLSIDEDGTLNASAGGGVQVNNTHSTSTSDTYSCNYINNLNNYSTEERVVGEWLGKTLYRKMYTTYAFASDDNVKYLVLETNENINPVNCYGTLKLGTFNALFPTPDAGLGYISTVYKNSSNEIYITTNTTRDIGALECVLFYTKTTD